MGFKTGAIAKVWEVIPVSDLMTRVKLSINHKNKKTGEFETEFNDYVIALGTATARNAAKLAKGDSIKLGDVDVTRRYDKESGKTYINWKVFSFEPVEGGSVAYSNDSEPTLPF